MKRSSIFSITLGLFTFLLFSGFTPQNINNPGPVSVNRIKYQVNIQHSNELSLCNAYLVQIIDENHQMVMPSKVFIPGVSSYTFYENGPVVGVRAAVLVRAGYNNFICSQELFTSPDIKSGIFLRAYTYNYLLQPTFIPKEIIK